MEIFKLVGSIVVDSSDADKSIRKTEGKAEGLAKKMSSGVKTAAAWGAAIGAAAIAAGKAMYDLSADVAATGDEIDKGAKRMRISNRQYQELQYVSKLCGINMTTMEKAAKKLEDTDIDLSTAINNIMSLGDEQDRVNAAIDLFGENIAYELMPLLGLSQDEYENTKKELEELGGVMSDDMVQNSADFQDAVTRLDTAWGGLKTQVAEYVMPALTNCIDWMARTGIPAVKQFIDVLGEAYGGGEWFSGFEFGAASGSAGMHRQSAGNKNGKFATGLPEVPYDGFGAILHRGETVLNPNDTSKLQELIQNGGNSEPVNITVQNVLDGKVIGEFSYKYSRQKARALGV